MRHQLSTVVTRTCVVVVAASLALLTAGCGDTGSPSPKSGDADRSGSASSSAPATADTALGRGTWLLALSSAGGADAEKATTTYLSYDPSTGATRVRTMPGVSTPNADVPEAALLVSTDHRWAIPDTGVPRAQSHSGKLVVYSTTSTASKVVDIVQRSGDSSVRALGWAFDPQKPATLRVVDSHNRVWSLDVSGGKATRTGTLARGPWVFTDGFNHNSGEPYVESITDDSTMPPGNGTADTSPISRAGGTVLGSGSAGLAELPQSPCRLAAAFTAQDGTTWTFCADGASIRTYVLADGSDHWSAYGKPSRAVAPEAAGFGFAIPTTG